MAVDSFIYQGINRAVSDYTGARACEELINLRPTEGGLVPVKDFNALFSNKAWDRVFVHYTTSGPKYIVVTHTSSSVSVSYIPDVQAPGTTTTLFSVTSLANATAVQDVIDHLYYAAAGNILLFSVCAPTAGKYENHAFTWKFDETEEELRYVAMDGTVTVDMDVDDAKDGSDSDLYIVHQEIMNIDKNSSVAECTEAVQAGLNAIQEENPDLCLGPVVIAVAYKTTDGNTFWTGNWRVYDPVQTVRVDPLTPYRDSTSEPAPEYSSFFDKYGYGYLVQQTQDGVTSVGWISVAGTKVRLEFDQVSGWDKDSSIIQSLEVYCSKPVLYLDPRGAKDGLFEVDETHHGYHLYLPGVEISDMNLGDQLLYHQASIEMASLAEGGQTVNLTFGGSAQLGEETLIADAGALQRFGRVLSYNARFHFYDSVARIKIDMPSFTWSGGTAAVPFVLVRYADDDQGGLMYIGTTAGDLGVAEAVVAPSLNIREVITCTPDGQGYVYVTTYRMAPSSAYNYAICTGGATTVKISNSQFQNSAYYTLIQGGVTSTLDNTETDAINVTEQYNPFVFRVEHSYKAPGNIIDVQPQMAGVVDASYGRDPLNVFTERGLYALTQGSANVLYGAFLPLSNLKAQRGGIPVEAGTFFLADGALWLVSGRRVTLISEALSQGPHKYIRSCAGYRKLSGTDTGYDVDGNPVTPVADPVYDVSPYLSQTDFKTFVSGTTGGANPIPQGQLSYNRNRMEILVSNPAYGYTYILSLKNYQWYKISKRLWQDEPGSTAVNTPGSTTGTVTVLDMADEQAFNNTPLLIHMQSRPFSMGYQYSHVHRIVAMMRAKLPTANEKITAALYGSDDLQHWKLLAYGKWSGKTEFDTESEEYVDTPLFLSQLRTPPSARSWRYYTVCIGGPIPVNPDFPTDIGPVLVDYQPVNRRLG